MGSNSKVLFVLGMITIVVIFLQNDISNQNGNMNGLVDNSVISKENDGFFIDKNKVDQDIEIDSVNSSSPVSIEEEKEIQKKEIDNLIEEVNSQVFDSSGASSQGESSTKPDLVPVEEPNIGNVDIDFAEQIQDSDPELSALLEGHLEEKYILKQKVEMLVK